MGPLGVVVAEEVGHGAQGKIDGQDDEEGGGQGLMEGQDLVDVGVARLEEEWRGKGREVGGHRVKRRRRRNRTDVVVVVFTH